jgi:hypothetical protein
LVMAIEVAQHGPNLFNGRINNCGFANLHHID